MRLDERGNKIQTLMNVINNTPLLLSATLMLDVEKVPFSEKHVWNIQRIIK